MLNQAAGDRRGYHELARHLADRGIASLRLDLRGDGESTNLETFNPGEVQRDPLIWDAEADVSAALDFLASRGEVDGERVAVVGASYSGEEMAEAGRLSGYAVAYVALSPGSFSDTSIDAIDTGGVPWLLVTARNDSFLGEITASVQARSEDAQVEVLPGSAHATDMLGEHPDLAERLAVWLAYRLLSAGG